MNRKTALMSTGNCAALVHASLTTPKWPDPKPGEIAEGVRLTIDKATERPFLGEIDVDLTRGRL